MARTLAATTDERKHTFDFPLDSERPFGHDGHVRRTYVRRRRWAAAGLILVVGLLIGSPVASAFGGSGEDDQPGIVHVVQAGETLWSIAEGQAPARDPREVIHEIVDLNGLDDAPLVPGQTLDLPADG